MTPQNKGFAKFIALPVLGLIGLSIIFSGGSGSSPPDEPVAKNAAEAAQIGDVVTLRYPNLTIMCKSRTDAAMVYIAGEQAMRQTYRLEKSAYKAFGAAREAQKIAMASAYSCEWAPDKKGITFVVKEKEVVGDKDSLYYVAEYCLTPDTSNSCWWIEETATMNPQIVRVQSKIGSTAQARPKADPEKVGAPVAGNGPPEDSMTLRVGDTVKLRRNVLGCPTLNLRKALEESIVFYVGDNEYEHVSSYAKKNCDPLDVNTTGLGRIVEKAGGSDTDMFPPLACVKFDDRSTCLWMRLVELKPSPK